MEVFDAKVEAVCDCKLLPVLKTRAISSIMMLTRV
jgi:hypothetical protein